MKGFDFRLKGYLKIKRFEEKNSWNEVLKQETRTSQLKIKIDNLIMLQQKTKEQLDHVGTARFGAIAHADLIHESLQGLQTKLHMMIEEYQAEAKVLEKLQAIHAEKRKELKVLEKVEERKKQEFKIQKNKEDQKKMNEIGTLYSSRKEKDNE